MRLDVQTKTEAETRLRHGLVGQAFAGGRWVGTPIIELTNGYSLSIESSWCYYDAASSPEPIDTWEKASIPPVEDLMLRACQLRHTTIHEISLGQRIANLLLTFATGEQFAIFGNDPLYECWSMNHYAEETGPSYSVYNLPGGGITYMEIGTSGNDQSSAG